jgi:hypothetical protein
MKKYLSFKDEYPAPNGEPEGPIEMVEEPEPEKGDPPLSIEELLMGGPYVPPCLCESPQGKKGEECAACGKQIPKWVTLAEAEAEAERLGLPLVQE